MDLFPHCNNFCLSDGWVKSILHLFFKLDFTLPKKDLTFSFHNLTKNVSFFVFEVCNLHLESDRFVFQFFKLLHELFLNVVVVICKLILSICVAVEQIVQLIHLECLILEGDLKFSDLLAMLFDFTVKSQLLLIKDGFLSEHVIITSVYILFMLLLCDEFNLVFDPFLLDLSDLFIDFFDLLFDTFALVLKRSFVFFTIFSSRKVSTLSV